MLKNKYTFKCLYKHILRSAEKEEEMKKKVDH